MKPFVLRLSLFGLLFCVGVFFGIDIASKGMEQVYGPADSIQEDTQADSTKEKKPDENENSAPSKPGYIEPVVQNEILEQQGLQGESYATMQSGKISKIAEGFGSLLQNAAQGVVDLIVGFFDGLLV